MMPCCGAIGLSNIPLFYFYAFHCGDHVLLCFKYCESSLGYVSFFMQDVSIFMKDF